MSTKRVLNFNLVLGKTANHAIVVKDGTPNLTTDSREVVRFFADFPQVHVKHASRRSLLSAAELESMPENQAVLQWSSKRWGIWNVPMDQPLPREGVNPSLTAKRLQRQFTQAPNAVRPLRPQRTLMKEYADIDFAQDYVGPMLIMWEMGSGKTLAIQLTTQQSGLGPPRKAVIVCSNTMIGYWLENVQRVAVTTATRELAESRPYKETCTHYDIVGYTEFKKRHDEYMHACDVFVMDEAHEVRNYTSDWRAAIQGIQAAHISFFLTGTPQVNSPRDLMGLLALMGEDISEVRGTEDDGEVRWGGTMVHKFQWPIERFRKLVKGNVSFYAPEFHAQHEFREMYPRVVTRVVPIPLSVEQTMNYLVSRGRLDIADPHDTVKNKGKGKDKSKCKMLRYYRPAGNHYRHAEVMACNERDIRTEESAKAQWIVRHLSDAATRKKELPVVIYSAFLENGVDIVDEALRASPKTRDLRIRRITGKIQARERDAIVNDFNGGRVDVLFISKAGGTGLNLLGAYSMICMEEFDNTKTGSQVWGRIIRADSHAKGHEDVVTIYKLEAVFPMAELRRSGRLKGTDAWLEEEAKDLWPRAKGTIPGAWIRQEMARVVHAEEEGGKTVNAQFRERNVKKAAEIERYDAVLREASIPMPMGSIREAPQAGAGSARPATVESRLPAVKRAMRDSWTAWNPSYIKTPTWSRLVGTALRTVMEADKATWVESHDAVGTATSRAFQEAVVAHLSQVTKEIRVANAAREAKRKAFQKKQKDVKARKALHEKEKAARARAREQRAREKALEEKAKAKRRAEREAKAKAKAQAKASRAKVTKSKAKAKPKAKSKPTKTKTKAVKRRRTPAPPKSGKHGKLST